MSGTTDQITGRIKEAAGAITDNDKLRNEGKLEQATGKIKQTAEKVIDNVKNAVEGKSNCSGESACQ